jgi:hypothetical protein
VVARDRAGIVDGPRDARFDVHLHQAGAYANEDALTLTGQLNVGDARSAGWTGQDWFPDWVPEIRLGRSFGSGLGTRFGHGDVDHDGYREIGPGVDVGPFSADVRSDWPHRAWSALFD